MKHLVGICIVMENAKSLRAIESKTISFGFFPGGCMFIHVALCAAALFLSQWLDALETVCLPLFFPLVPLQ